MCISERDVSFINDPLIVRLIYSTGHPAGEEAFITDVPSTLTPPSLRRLDGANAHAQHHKDRRTHAFCFKGEELFFLTHPRKRRCAGEAPRFRLMREKPSLTRHVSLRQNFRCNIHRESKLIRYKHHSVTPYWGQPSTERLSREMGWRMWNRTDPASRGRCVSGTAAILHLTAQWIIQQFCNYDFKLGKL